MYLSGSAYVQYRDLGIYVVHKAHAIEALLASKESRSHWLRSLRL